MKTAALPSNLAVPARLAPWRRTVAVLALTCLHAVAAVAQVSIGIAVPGISIGIDLPVYPEFVQVPSHPVYYAPRQKLNLFFYDGLYWVYQHDDWYTSSWYGGPWQRVQPYAVPAVVLRVPVRYYRKPPAYFYGWRGDSPPQWDQHWGREWSEQRAGWDRWDRRSTPAPAPLPVYQRGYDREHYPGPEQQRELHSRNYRYQPRDEAWRRQMDAPGRGNGRGPRGPERERNGPRDQREQRDQHDRRDRDDEHQRQRGDRQR